MIFLQKKLTLFQFELFSTLFTFITGILLHFTYDWFHQNKIIGLFSAVNESTWEHLKLLFFPMLITSLIGTFYYKDEYPNYLTMKTKGILFSLTFLVCFFYIYTGILGTNIAWLNILSFFIAAILGEIYAYSYQRKYLANNKFSYIILIFLIMAFVLFTFKPLPIGLFKDPHTGYYGITK